MHFEKIQWSKISYFSRLLDFGNSSCISQCNNASIYWGREIFCLSSSWFKQSSESKEFRKFENIPTELKHFCHANQKKLQIYSDIWSLRSHVLFFSITAWLLPSVLAAYLYTCVCTQVWKQLTDLSHAIQFQGTIFLSISLFIWKKSAKFQNCARYQWSA